MTKTKEYREKQTSKEAHMLALVPSLRIPDPDLLLNTPDTVLPKEEKSVWILEEEIGFWNSQGGDKGKHVCFLACLLFSIFLSLSHIKYLFACLFVSPLPLELMIT